ncbi:hypothetical protein [Kangiella sediminilitoris]|uniref:Uncharacterized protein n=1 Tax=Kangiella sediminilitoris TaxID=1144748 RepID=A0A1B3B9V5_9GAMM|nr:hypothetical protein [Kangiella sediminilitoris]AOE49538.1 hypothetical protein KS2013_815 [Kangiella sediminilitoris]
MAHLELEQLTEEQRLKITQGIVDDLVRALNLGNYSLIWRYLSDDLANRLDEKAFRELHQKTSEQFQNLQAPKLQQTELTPLQLNQCWHLESEADITAELALSFVPIKEFLAINRLDIKPV